MCVCAKKGIWWTFADPEKCMKKVSEVLKKAGCSFVMLEWRLQTGTKLFCKRWRRKTTTKQVEKRFLWLCQKFFGVNCFNWCCLFKKTVSQCTTGAWGWTAKSGEGENFGSKRSINAFSLKKCTMGLLTLVVIYQDIFHLIRACLR